MFLTDFFWINSCGNLLVKICGKDPSERLWHFLQN